MVGTRTFRLLLVTVSLLSAPATSHAQGMTGLDFLRDCEGRSEKGQDLGTIVCGTYLQGFVDSHILVQRYLPPTAPRFCLPKEGLETEQVMLIVTKYLREKPSELHQSARTSIFLALGKAFPCAQ
jgi:hypothetical protein